MTSRKIIETPTSRRAFLRRSLISGAGAAAVVAAAGTASVASETLRESATTGQSSRKGYRLTPHILDYYRTAGL